ncbi:MAG: hypothetical protein ACREIC_20180, partial [Limisphaerales bacterium]
MSFHETINDGEAQPSSVLTVALMKQYVQRVRVRRWVNRQCALSVVVCGWLGCVGISVAEPLWSLNTNSIAILDDSVAQPYPSQIFVNGLTQSVIQV